MKTVLLSVFFYLVITQIGYAQNSLVKNYQHLQVSGAQQVSMEESKGKVGSEAAAYANEYEALNSGLSSYGYIVWGTEDELLEDGIISKDTVWSYKEVAHFGREEMERFIQVETDSLNSINIPGVLKYMLTDHAEESYKVQKGEITELKILEKEKFWDKGNFLVVVTKE